MNKTNNKQFEKYEKEIKPLFPDTEHKKIDLNEEFKNVDFFYQGVRKAKFLGSKLNIFTFMCYVPKIDKKLLESYFDLCTDKSNVNFLNTFLFGGIVAGVDMCVSVLVSENIDDDAISTCLKTKKARNKTLFEGAIYDLSSQTLYRKKTSNIIGFAFNSFRNEYVSKFDIKI